MFKNYLKIILRNFKKRMGYSCINIFGLSISIVCCILIFLWVYDELSYDRFYPGADRIFRVGYYGVVQGNTVHGVQACPTMAPVLNSDFPEVEYATRFRKVGYPVVRYGETTFREERFFAADSMFFDVFRLPFIAGDSQTALQKPHSIVINESTAEKYFGADDPIGKTLNTDNRRDWQITGVVQDVPAHAHFHFDFLVSMNSYRGMGQETTWLSNNYYTYFLLQEGVDWRIFERKLQKEELHYTKPQIAEMFGMSWEQIVQTGNEYYHFLQPLTYIHLHSHLEHELEANGDMVYVTIFIIAALGILVLAVANFVNLSTARSLNRVREVGIRKSIGSTRGLLMGHFLTESILYTFFSMMLALMIVTAVLPSFERLYAKNLITPMRDPLVLLYIIGFILIVGLISGLYPAFFLSSFKPVSVLNNDHNMFKGAWIRNILVVFQFSIAIAILVGTFVVNRQVQYIQSKKLNMSRERILNIHNADGPGKDIRAFKQIILKNSKVSAVSNSNYIPGQLIGDDFYNVPGRPDNEKRVVRHMFADADYSRVYGLKMADGMFFPNDFSSGDRCLVLNESAAQLFLIQDPVGKNLKSAGHVFPIAGIVKDFHFRSIHHPIAPLVIQVLGPDAWGGKELSLRVADTDIRETLLFLESTWKRMSGNKAFNYEFFDDYYNDIYRAEFRTSSIFIVFSIFSVFIAGLGLLGLSAFMAEQRTKEIAVRKVLGATSASIVSMLVKQFIRWVIVSTVIAWPLAYYFMTNWLQNFSYHVKLGIGIFVPSFIFALLVVMPSVSFQTIKAARANPAESLRYE